VTYFLHRVLTPGASLVLVLTLSVVLPFPASALPPEDGYDLARRLMFEKRKERRIAAEALREANEPTWIPVITDALFFTPVSARKEAIETLVALAGEDAGDDYHDWVEYVGRAGIAPPAGYLGWKGELLSRIDPIYREILYDGAPVRIRLDEVVWGGVRLDGIPVVERPEQIPASRASYLRDRDRVFGVRIGGDARAYPVKILAWHEMMNDVVDGEPVTLSYCTLCGSGILFSARGPSGEAYTFGTSGLLYRSNKLMFDRGTLSLWNNLTGEPVIGRAAAEPVPLEVLPMTLTTWRDWRSRHPETTVIKPDRALARRFGFRYQEGAADRARDGVEFPVWRKSDLLERETEVYAMRLGAHAKAWPVEVVVRETVINDRIGDLRLVLLGDPESGAIRAYARGELAFRAGDRPTRVVDGDGRVWRVEEEALVPPDGAGPAPLPRLPGHVAFWFGWYGFFPDTEVYAPRP
jgi:hypothetical protein